MNRIVLQTGIYGVNTYIVYDDKSKECLIVDPSSESNIIINKINTMKLSPKYIILTHAHGDHIGVVKELKEKLNIPILVHKDDYEMLMDPALNLSKSMSYGPISIKADEVVKDNDFISLGDQQLKVIHTPGHTKGGICLFFDNCLISGDTLFKGSIGRTDLYGGSFEDIMDSIINKILILPDDTIVLPGHGPSTTIKEEKLTNPYIKEYLNR
jgi:glyoxylase-like metal-dependent hydrolase (beta-lactamase superfamily II)